jgi:hypothetical protein
MHRAEVLCGAEGEESTAAEGVDEVLAAMSNTHIHLIDLK